MSLGTNTKPGFSVRDILDLPDSAGTEETEEDDTEEASAEKRGFNGRDLRERGGGCCFGRWSRGAGDLHFSREKTCLSKSNLKPVSI